MSLFNEDQQLASLLAVALSDEDFADSIDLTYVDPEYEEQLRTKSKHHLLAKKALIENDRESLRQLAKLIVKYDVAGYSNVEISSKFGLNTKTIQVLKDATYRALSSVIETLDPKSILMDDLMHLNFIREEAMRIIMAPTHEVRAGTKTLAMGQVLAAIKLKDELLQKAGLSPNLSDESREVGGKDLLEELKNIVIDIKEN